MLHFPSQFFFKKKIKKNLLRKKSSEILSISENNRIFHQTWAIEGVE
jgi:hypothetical protein